MGEYFPFVNEIEYEGAENNKEFAFNYYNPHKIIGGKKMKEQLRFSMAFWHTINEKGTDPFGDPTIKRPWDEIDDPMERAASRVEAAFEFMEKLGIGYFCFHDIDVAPLGETLAESNSNLDVIVDLIEKKMKETGIELLWGTSNLFLKPEFMHGAATSPSADVFALAAARVKKAMEITNRLDGDNYVFWGGREGYETLLNTDMALEQDNMARFLQMAVDYSQKIGFEGQLLIEPKPKEPTKHQYDFDAEAVTAFLRRYDLQDKFSLNIEGNHATLAGHTFQHELRYARINDMLGSVDANQGDLMLGWDTDQFPSNIYSTALAMYEILKAGGIAPGGLNFDARVRRASPGSKDLFYGHILGMDSFARGLEVAHSLLESGELEEFISERYASYNEGIGAAIKEDNIDFVDLEEYVIDRNINELQPESGNQERLEAIVNRHLIEA